MQHDALASEPRRTIYQSSLSNLAPGGQSKAQRDEQFPDGGELRRRVPHELSALPTIAGAGRRRGASGSRGTGPGAPRRSLGGTAGPLVGVRDPGALIGFDALRVGDRGSPPRSGRPGTDPPNIHRGGARGGKQEIDVGPCVSLLSVRPVWRFAFSVLSSSEHLRCHSRRC